MLASYDDDVQDIGPILYASVDRGLTVIVGERGTTRFPTPIIERVEFPVEPPPLYVVRAPDDDALPVAIGAAMLEPDAPKIEGPERLSHAQIAALMRHKVEGGEGPLGGGGAGRRRTKPMKRIPIREVVDDENEREASEVERTRVRVYGLSKGEEDFFDRRPGERERIAEEFIGELLLDPGIDPAVRAQIGRMTYSFSLYIENDVKRRLLKRFAGPFRRRLIQHAHVTDGPRVKAIDGR